MIQQLMSDPIIEEIHRTRREMSDKFHGDCVAMLDDARRRQEASSRPVWQPKPPIKTVNASGVPPRSL